MGKKSDYLTRVFDGTFDRGTSIGIPVKNFLKTLSDNLFIILVLVIGVPFMFIFGFFAGKKKSNDSH